MRPCYPSLLDVLTGVGNTLGDIDPLVETTTQEYDRIDLFVNYADRIPLTHIAEAGR